MDMVWYCLERRSRGFFFFSFLLWFSFVSFSFLFFLLFSLSFVMLALLSSIILGMTFAYDRTFPFSALLCSLGRLPVCIVYLYRDPVLIVYMLLGYCCCFTGLGDVIPCYLV